MTILMRCILVGIVASIPIYFMSDYFIQKSMMPYNNSGYNSLINALLTWIVVGLFGLLDCKEKRKTSLSGYYGVGILLSGFVLFISNVQLGGIEKNFTVILMCFIVTPIFGLMNLMLKNNQKKDTNS